jgi:hypothetical protein
MQNLIAKRILEANDVSALIPVKGKLSLIPEKIARQYQIVAFDGDGTQVCLITTNTFSEQLKTIYDGMTKAGYTSDVYYTDEAGMAIAL